MHKHIRRLSFVAITVTFVALAACGTSTSGTGSSGTPTTTPAGTATPVASGNGDQILASAKAAMPKAAKFNGTLNVSGNMIHEQASYIVSPYETDITVSASGIPSGETISTQTATYIKVGGQWQKSPVARQPPISSLDSGHAALEEGTTATLVGTETVNGVSAYHLNVPIATSQGTQNGDFWVRTDTYYLVKVSAKAQVTEPTTGTTIDADLQLNYTAWDSQVTITIPTV